jgi:hypothetical protein
MLTAIFPYTISWHSIATKQHSRSSAALRAPQQAAQQTALVAGSRIQLSARREAIDMLTEQRASQLQQLHLQEVCIHACYTCSYELMPAIWQYNSFTDFKT